MVRFAEGFWDGNISLRFKDVLCLINGLVLANALLG